MASEDITFCANKGCPDMKCERNPKHIRLPIPHSYALFANCAKWKPNGAKWLIDLIEGAKNGN